MKTIEEKLNDLIKEKGLTEKIAIEYKSLAYRVFNPTEDEDYFENYVQNEKDIEDFINNYEERIKVATTNVELENDIKYDIDIEINNFTTKQKEQIMKNISDFLDKESLNKPIILSIDKCNVTNLTEKYKEESFYGQHTGTMISSQKEVKKDKTKPKSPGDI